MAGVVFALDVLFVIQFVFFGDGSWVTQTALVITTASFAWLLFVRPKVMIYDEGITIVNPFITATIGWGEVDSIETKFAFTVESGNAKVVAWAAPAPGRFHGRSVHASELKGIDYDKDFGIRPGDSPRSASGTAAHLARTRLANFRKSKQATSAKRSGVLNYVGVALAALSVASIAFVLLVRV